VADVVACSTLACAYDWLREFQALAAAIVAILAALIAYAGARRRANALLDAAAEDTDARRRSTANALWAELAQCLSKLTADLRALRDDTFLRGGTLVLRVTKTPVFDARPDAVGALEAQDAFAVARAYQLLKALDDSYREALAAKSVTRPQIEQLGRLVDEVAAAVRAAAERLRETAGISTAAADRAMTAYGAFGPPAKQ